MVAEAETNFHESLRRVDFIRLEFSACILYVYVPAASTTKLSLQITMQGEQGLHYKAG